MRILLLTLGMLASATPAMGTTFTTVLEGTGIQPNVGASANGTLYIVDPYGGANGNGGIYALQLPKLTRIYSFTGGADGSAPNRRLQVGANGDLYGTTRAGGTSGAGTIFDLSLAGNLTPIHQFVPPSHGVVPQDGLAVDPNGALYGTTSMEAIQPGNGTIFEMTPSGFSVLYYFRSQSDGHCPFTGLQRDSQGNMFGTTVGLGFGGEPMGSVWEFTAARHLRTLYAFTNGIDGEWPEITPTLDASDTIWGVSATQSGNAYAGSIWSIGSHGFTIRHAFTGNGDGWQPNGPLLLASNGALYGTTVGGGITSGSSGYGTVFRITSAGAFTVIHEFENRSDGAHPTGGLVQAADGRIYGGTQSGTIFAITP